MEYYDVKTRFGHEYIGLHFNPMSKKWSVKYRKTFKVFNTEKEARNYITNNYVLIK